MPIMAFKVCRVSFVASASPPLSCCLSLASPFISLPPSSHCPVCLAYVILPPQCVTPFVMSAPLNISPLSSPMAGAAVPPRAPHCTDALQQVSSHLGGFACQQACLPPHPLPVKTGISDVVSLALPSFSPHATPKTVSDVTITTVASTGTGSTTTNAPPPPHVVPVNFTNDYLPLSLLDTSRVARSICSSIDSTSHKIFSACQVCLA